MVARGVRPLVDSWVTPNHLTFLRLLTGLLAAACFLPAETSWNYAGAAIFVVSFVLDRADGALARLSGQTSVAGHHFDLVVDALCNALVFVAIGIGVRQGPLGDWSIVCGLVAGISVLAILAIVVRGDVRLGPGSVAVAPSGGFDPDDAMIVVPIGMVLNMGVPLVAAAAIGTPLTLLYFLIRFRAAIR